LRSAVIATAGPGEALAGQLRAAAARRARDGGEASPAPVPPPRPRTVRYAWAMLLARIYDVLPLVCSRCGHAMKILAFVTAGATVRRILAPVGEPVTPPAILPSRAPPREEFGWGEDGAEDFDQRTVYSEQPD
jgi:hypothetical protein